MKFSTSFVGETILFVSVLEFHKLSVPTDV